jgi:hypothetical protein
VKNHMRVKSADVKKSPRKIHNVLGRNFIPNDLSERSAMNSCDMYVRHPLSLLLELIEG